MRGVAKTGARTSDTMVSKPMKCLMYNWRGDAKNLPAWFSHYELAELSWEQIIELYDTGNDVMVCHNADGPVVLYVDDKRFTRR